jgi:co-chaperonin GroES (HSP10)
MSLNSLKIATDGYLKRTTKAALVIAVAGYLNYGSVPPPNPPSVGSGGSGYVESYRDVNKEQRERIERIIIEDSQIIAIVEITLKNFII